MNPLAYPILAVSYAALAASVWTLSYWGMAGSAAACVVGWLIAENT